MRRIACMLTLATFCFPAHAADIDAVHKLKSATVYSARATLTREAVIEIPAGANTIVFKNLPASLMPESLRAEGSSAATVKFGALAHRLVMSEELAAPREQELTDQLEKLTDQRKTIEADKAALSARQDFLKSLSLQASLRTREDIATIDLKPDQWDAAGKAVYGGMADIAKTQLAHDIALRDLDRQIARVQGELAQLRTGQTSTYEIALPLEADSAGSLTVSLSYQIPDASWAPLYDARLDTATGKLELVQYGAVSQYTGEDWQDVSLTLSTAQPQRGAGLPDLDTMWVSIYEAMPMAVQSFEGRARNAYANLSADKAMMDMAVMENAPIGAGMPAAPMQKAAVFEGAVIDNGGFVSEYKIPGPATVKADGTQSKLLIGAFDTDNEMRIQIKPQISAEAYLVAHAKLKGEAPILSGPVSLFRDGAYVGEAFLPLLRPGQESDLAFGIDDQISVKRRTMKDERSEDGVLAKDGVLERHFVTEIQNLRGKPVDVVVLETVPVPQDERIKVDLIDNATTKGFVKDPDNVKGLMRWGVKIDAKGKTDVKLGWKVSWPKDHQLGGL